MVTQLPYSLNYTYIDRHPLELLDRDHPVLGEWHEEDHDVREIPDDVRLTHDPM